LAGIENGTHGLCFGSGMAAIDAVLRLLKPGDEAIVTNDLYGGTYRLFTKVLANYGIKFHFISMANAQEVAQHFNAHTKMIWMETPTNPLLNIIDIEAISSIARENHVLSVVDNTFASPY